MGQSNSAPTSVPSSLTKSQAFYRSLSKTLPPLSVQDYEAIFASLAQTDDTGEVTYWTEDTLARFLEVPSKIGSLLFKSASYLAALPTLENVPAPLDKEGLGIAAILLTQQIPDEVLSRRELNRLLFNSFAEIPPKATDSETDKEASEKRYRPYGPQIPVATMTSLILFLLSMSTSHSLTTPETTLVSTTESSRRHAPTTAKAIINAIQGYAKSPSDLIHYDAFRAFIERDSPYFFDPLVPLFQNFFFDRQKWTGKTLLREGWIGAMETENLTDTMNLFTLAQLSMFFPKEWRMGKMVALYAGSRDGFSMGMFESKVLKYPGPSILLVRGITKSSETDPEEVLLGVYVSTPWKSSSKDNFGDKNCLLFQLLPSHTLYPAAPYHTQFAYYNSKIGIGFGTPPPQVPRRQSLTSQTLIQHTSDPQVSFSLDPSLELGKFTHIPPGSTFQASPVQGEYSLSIDIEEVEVWGCGVENAKDEQKRAWDYERREAERRQNVRIREDLASDRALLEMAGIIGGNRSGGSV